MRIRLGGLCVLAYLVFAAVPALQARDLSFEDRVQAQRAVEGVYLRHRIWPEQNSALKPSLDDLTPESAIRGKVEDYLRKANALEKLFEQPITADQLQGEMERIARNTKQPEVLAELFTALHDDPFLIAECLARPVLADRLLRERFAQEDRFQGSIRTTARDALRLHGTVADMKTMGGEYQESVFKLGVRGPEPLGQPVTGGGPVLLSGNEWGELSDWLRGRTGRTDLGTPRMGSLHESADSLSVTAILERTSDTVKVATVHWPKRSFSAWWELERRTLPAALQAPGDSYAKVAPVESACANDTWTPTIQEVPDPRALAVGVWTGSELLVWGGLDGGFGVNGNGQVNTGGRYNPSTDTWTLMSLSGAPPGVTLGTAVWTGTEMIVWGGRINLSEVNTGGRYNPSTDTWTATSLTGAPVARAAHTAVWTGTQMVVWGGVDNSLSPLSSGSRYNPSTDTWTATSASPSATARYFHSAVWTGTTMIVWGGTNNTTDLSTGSRYNPTTNTWVVTSPTSVPSARERHTAVWTGTEMIVWGGLDFGSGLLLNTGGRYNPSTNAWRAGGTTLTAAPSGRTDHTTVWTGTEMIVWGGGDDSVTGEANTGGRYNPSTDTWTPTSIAGAPASREGHTAVWTGTRMIVVMGYDFQAYLNSGGRYDPASDSWTPTSRGSSAPAARWSDSAIWTGNVMIVWGGYDGSPLNTGSRYDPTLDAWAPTSTGSGVPPPRWDHAAVWTGREMIVAAGRDVSSNLDTGGRYDPSLDTWAATSTLPILKQRPTGVWTGSRMVLWGGFPYDTSGALYEPVADTWTLTSTVGAPGGRWYHTAVWAGNRMIVWGGFDSTGVSLNTGGKYDPVADSWVPTSLTGVPPVRGNHVAVWTGTEMLVWGGHDQAAGTWLSSGWRYNPGTDSWVQTANTSAPIGREAATAVWTGREMVVWGGYNGDFASPLLGPTNTGGRYDPVSDTWTATSVGANVPGARQDHGAVWTGSRMIVWGQLSAGGLYCAVPACTVTTWYYDPDGDGHGNSSNSVLSCTQPPGYAASASGGDCDESNAAVWSTPGEVQSVLFAVDKVTLSWLPPSNPGATSVVYDTLRSGIASSFLGATCVESNDGSDTIAMDASLPSAGSPFYYLTRAENACPSGTGSLGTSSAGVPRNGRACP